MLNLSLQSTGNSLVTEGVGCAFVIYSLKISENHSSFGLYDVHVHIRFMSKVCQYVAKKLVVFTSSCG